MSFSEFSALIASDLRRYTDYGRSINSAGPARWRVVVDTVLFKAGFQAVFLHRLGHWLYRNGLVFLARCAMRLNLALCGADIGFAAEIGPACLIGHPVGVVIAHKTRIGANSTILGGVLFGVRNWSPEAVNQLPSAGDDCVFCARASVLGGCTLGDAVVVGVNAVVDRDVPAGALAHGAPLELVSGRGRQLVESWALMPGRSQETAKA